MSQSVTKLLDDIVIEVFNEIAKQREDLAMAMVVGLKRRFNEHGIALESPIENPVNAYMSTEPSAEWLLAFARLEQITNLSYELNIADLDTQ